jgi:glycosyltransferase involved in cell wall biosynthesis
VGLYVQELLAGLARIADAEGLQVTAIAPASQALPAGVERLPCPIPFDRHGPAELYEHLRLPARLVRQPVDVFHGPNTIVPLPPLPCARVVTVHDVVFRRHPASMPTALRLLMRARTRASLVVADRVLAVSRFTADELRALYPRYGHKVQAVPSGTPQAAIEHRPDPARAHALLAGFGLQPGCYLCAVGTLEPRKNLVTLLQALALPECAGIRLALVGDRGWREGPLRQALGDLHPERVVLTGWLDDLQMRDLVASSAGLLYPSLYEGFGFPPLEALALGRPALCADLPPVRESCGDQVRRVPARDVQGWAQGLRRLLDEASPVHPWVGRDFDAVARDTVALYRQALAARRAR